MKNIGAFLDALLVVILVVFACRAIYLALNRPKKR